MQVQGLSFDRPLYLARTSLRYTQRSTRLAHTAGIHAFWSRRKGSQHAEQSQDERNSDDGQTLTKTRGQDISPNALPPMIMELTVEKGSSLQQLADKFGWDVEKLIEANGGSNNVREDTALRFQLPTPDDPQQLAELIGLKEGASRGTDTKFVASNPLAKNQQQKVSSATRKQGAPAAVSSPLIRLLGFGILGLLLFAGMARLGQTLTKTSGQTLKERASQRRKTHPMPSPISEGNLDSESTSGSAELQERIASNDTASSSQPSSMSDPISGLPLDAQPEEPAWLKLEQVYVVLSESGRTPTYRLLPQQPDELLWVVYEDKWDARCMLEWYRHDAKTRPAQGGEALDWHTSVTGKKTGSVEALTPMDCLGLVDLEKEGLAFVPAKAFVVELRLTQDDIWSSLVTSAFTLPHSSKDPSQATVKQLLQQLAAPQADSTDAGSSQQAVLQSPLNDPESLPVAPASATDEILNAGISAQDELTPLLNAMNLATEISGGSSSEEEQSAGTTSTMNADPLQPFKAMGDLLSQVEPGAGKATGFDIGEMRERFGSGCGTVPADGEFASMEVKPGGPEGSLTDIVPVPADLRPLWQQFQQIKLPEGTAGSKSSVDGVVEFVLEEVFQLVQTWSDRRNILYQQLETIHLSGSDEQRLEAAGIHYRDFLFQNMLQTTMQRLAEAFARSANGTMANAEYTDRIEGTDAASSNSNIQFGNGLKSDKEPESKRAPRKSKGRSGGSIRAWQSGKKASPQAKESLDTRKAEEESGKPIKQTMESKVSAQKKKAGKFDILDGPPERLRSDRWQQYPQLFALSCQDDEGENYLVLNLSETVLLEDRHLICFANHHDAFGYSQLMKASGDPTEFRVVAIEPRTMKSYLAGRESEVGVTAFAKDELPLSRWLRDRVPVKELHDKVAGAARNNLAGSPAQAAR